MGRCALQESRSFVVAHCALEEFLSVGCAGGASSDQRCPSSYYFPLPLMCVFQAQAQAISQPHPSYYYFPPRLIYF